MCAVRTWGYDQVSFIGKTWKPKKGFTDEMHKSRFENIVKPICELAGMPFVEGGEPGPYHTHFGKAVHMAWRENSFIWKFPYQKKHDHITITLRESFRSKERDSDRGEWEKFASWLENHGEKVVLVQDWDRVPIPLKDRWELYQCRMNFFTGGGPAALCMYSDAPYVTFYRGLVEHDYYLLTCHHWQYTNSQLPWARKNQRIVWRDDKFADMVFAYKKLVEPAASGAH